MHTIATIEQFINSLVAQGIHAGLAKAAVTEFYTAEGVAGAIYPGSSTEEGPATYTPEQAMAEFNNVSQGYHMQVTEQGIMLDGELTFNLQGEYL